MRGMSFVAAVTVIIAPMLIQPAFADRVPTPEERSSIEQKLRSLGFQSWKEIELDDGKWEIDDARHSDGIKYDLKLDPATLNVIKQERDD
jgi:hypothetical protein